MEWLSNEHDSRFPMLPDCRGNCTCYSGGNPARAGVVELSLDEFCHELRQMQNVLLAHGSMLSFQDSICTGAHFALRLPDHFALRVPDLMTVLFSWPAGDCLAHYIAAISACHVHAVRLARLLQIVIKNEVGNLRFEQHLCTQVQVATLYTPPFYCEEDGFDVPNTSTQAQIH